MRDLWINASISLGFLKKDSHFEKLSRKYEQLCYTHCDSIGVTTNAIGRDICERYEIDDNFINVVPNGVDTTFFKPLDVVKKHQIIYAGSIGHAQDLEKVIQAIKNWLVAMILHYCLLVMGIQNLN